MKALSFNGAREINSLVEYVGGNDVWLGMRKNSAQFYYT